MFENINLDKINKKTLLDSSNFSDISVTAQSTEVLNNVTDKHNNEFVTKEADMQEKITCFLQQQADNNKYYIDNNFNNCY